MSQLQQSIEPVSEHMEQQRIELADLIRRFTPGEGSFQTAIEPLFMVRYERDRKSTRLNSSHWE